MLKEYLSSNSISIVLVGEFNPAIIQPFWLASKKLIREVEAKNAKIEVIHNELTRIDLDWVFIEATLDRIEFKTLKDPYFEAVKDLACGIFEILNETPIKALGINHVFDYQLTTDTQYYEVGNKLTPLNNWSEFIDDPRMLQIEILEQKRRDKLLGYLRVRIQPSNGKNHVSVTINDHYDLNSGNGNNLIGRNKEIINILKDNWKFSLDRASKIPEEIWKSIKM